MTKWLFNSRGLPVAFVERGKVFSPLGAFIGEVIKGEIYNGYYKGEIIDDRVIVNSSKKYHLALKGSVPGARRIPKRPKAKSPIQLPTGLEDIYTLIDDCL